MNGQQTVGTARLSLELVVTAIWISSRHEPVSACTSSWFEKGLSYRCFLRNASNFAGDVWTRLTLVTATSSPLPCGDFCEPTLYLFGAFITLSIVPCERDAHETSLSVVYGSRYMGEQLA